MTDSDVCIIGAGPAGLATSRALQDGGISHTILEKHLDVGGIWDPDNEGSPMYESAHFISSKTMSGFKGFPMPDAYPDYPSNRQILAYIRSFADAHGLRKHIQFNTRVQSTRYENDRWSIETDKGTYAGFRWLVAANGVTWIPKVVSLPGQETFPGRIMHAVGYRRAETFRGKRVLIVGAGNSGVDIACDAAANAEAAAISLRRGYHLLPKHLFGTPIDVFGEQSAWMPLRLQQFTTAILLRILLGDLRRLGLAKPDHRILESHPIINSQLLHYLQHGDLQAKPDIARLDERSVHFVDGTHLEVDLIVLATGYHRSIPYLPEGMVSYEGLHPKAYLNVFLPDHPELFLNGFIETNGGAYKFFDQMAQLIAQGIIAQKEDGEAWQTLQRILAEPEPDLTGGVRYLDSDRHSLYVNARAYLKAVKKLCRTMGWPNME